MVESMTVAQVVGIITAIGVAVTVGSILLTVVYKFGQLSLKIDAFSREHRTRYDGFAIMSKERFEQMERQISRLENSVEVVRAQLHTHGTPQVGGDD